VLVPKVDAQLFKRIGIKNFKPVDIENPHAELLVPAAFTLATLLSRIQRKSLL
jgi:hypothetical protein